MDATATAGADEGAVGGLEFLWHMMLNSATGIRTTAAIVLVTGYLVTAISRNRSSPTNSFSLEAQRLVKTSVARSQKHTWYSRV
jgi:hypothetical protein